MTIISLPVKTKMNAEREKSKSFPSFVPTHICLVTQSHRVQVNKNRKESHEGIRKKMMKLGE